MDRETEKLLGDWNRACDPDVRLSASQLERVYVPLDAWPDADGKTQALRGPSAANRMVRHILSAAGPGQDHPASAQLFSGFLGTGKSTELSRVAEKLQDDGRFVVLRIHAGDFREMSNAPTQEEMAFLLAAGLCHAAEAALGTPANRGNAIWFRALLAKLKAAKIELNVEPVKWGPISIRAYLQPETNFYLELAKTQRERPNALRTILHELVIEVARECHRLNGQMVLLVDGLEKFYVSVTRVAEVYQGVADLFVNASDLLKLPDCHVVYTVPPMVGYLNPGLGQAYGGEVLLLTSVKLHQRPPGREDWSPGRMALAKILENRVDLNKLFGAEREACMARLITASGGHVRDLLRLMRIVLENVIDVGLPVGQPAVDDAIASMTRGRSQLLHETRLLLERIGKDGSLDDLTRDDLWAVSVAMDQYLVLCYYNGRLWADVHPLLWQRFQLGTI